MLLPETAGDIELVPGLVEPAALEGDLAQADVHVRDTAHGSPDGGGEAQPLVVAGRRVSKPTQG